MSGHRDDWYVRVPGPTHRTIELDGEPQPTVEITVRLGVDAFELLTTTHLPVREVWLAEQPDGAYAIGVVTPQHPTELGYQARAVENRDQRKDAQP